MANEELIAEIAELRRTIEGGFIALIAQKIISEKPGKVGSSGAIDAARSLVENSKPKLG
ncbi:MAG: hypothetical protein ABSF28_01945 [Terracidiphilus sp.]|jgi:hypothetical protein